VNGLLLLAISNAASAAVLAFAVVCLARALRIPAVVHLLWLAVLLRLLAPPLFELPVLASGAAEAGGALVVATEAWAGAAAAPAAAPVSLHAVLAAAWLAGAALVAGLAAVRVRRLRRLVATAAEPSPVLQAEVAQLAELLGVRPPRLAVVPGDLPPCLWSLGRPRLLLPAPLVAELDATGRRTVIAHELAHLARRDHWVRWPELLAVVLCWWNPLAWWASRRLRIAEEQSCDALVVQALPDHARAYATALVACARRLGRARPVSLAGVTGASDFSRLHGRITMIMSERPVRPHRLVLFATVAAVTVTLAVTPLLTSARPSAGDVVDARRISLELDDVPLAEALAVFAKESRYEFLMEPGLEARVTVQVADEPWDEALDRLLRARGLHWSVEGRKVLVRRQAPAEPAPARSADAAEPPPAAAPLMAGVGGVTTPEIVRSTRVEPEYPEPARAAGVGGKVFVEAIIRADGTVGDLKLLKESPGGLGFAEAAMKAIRQWRYEPALLAGEPVPVRFTVMISFTLPGGEDDPAPPVVEKDMPPPPAAAPPAAPAPPSAVPQPPAER
jgi:TonB family protein